MRNRNKVIWILCFFISASLFFFSCPCRDDTIPTTPKDEIKLFITRINPQGVITDSKISALLDSSIENSDAVGKGRPRIISLWSKKPDSLAIQLYENREDYLVGSANSTYTTLLDIDENPGKGWQFYIKNQVADSIKVQYWLNPDTLVIQDFENYDSKFNKKDWEFGTWNYRASITTEYKPGAGHNKEMCLKVDYDFEENYFTGGLCGLYFNLAADSNNTIDLKQYKKIEIRIMGDRDAGFPDKKLHIEFIRLTNPRQKERATLLEITENWKSFSKEIHLEFQPWEEPISETKIKDWAKINRLVITFSEDDFFQNQLPLLGTIYIDDIFLIDSDPMPPKP